MRFVTLTMTHASSRLVIETAYAADLPKRPKRIVDETRAAEVFGLIRASFEGRAAIAS